LNRFIIAARLLISFQPDEFVIGILKSLHRPEQRFQVDLLDNCGQSASQAVAKSRNLLVDNFRAQDLGLYA
jgi:hypothetical protein